MTILKRAAKPTPKFFKKIRAIGLSVAAIGATIIAAPVACSYSDKDSRLPNRCRWCNEWCQPGGGET